jgi:hypothetical protein
MNCDDVVVGVAVLLVPGMDEKLSSESFLFNNILCEDVNKGEKKGFRSYSNTNIISKAR